MVPLYALLDRSEVPCPHLVMAQVGNGDSIPCYRLPEPCSRCWPRFELMLRTEAEFVLERCDQGKAWLCRVPADDDPFRGQWHLAVGSRLRAFGSDAAACALETLDMTVIISSHPLWGGSGRMLRSRWQQVDVGAVRRELDDLLEVHAVSRAEPFYRPRFNYLVPVGPGGQWGVPLLEAGFLERAERVVT